MKKTKCYSVRLESLVRISPKAFKATAFDGSSDIIPASQVFGRDFEVEKSEAWWIAAWLLEKKNLTYSRKKQAFFKTPVSNKQEKTVTKEDTIIKTHRPDYVEAVENNIIESLKKLLLSAKNEK